MSQTQQYHDELGYQASYIPTGLGNCTLTYLRNCPKPSLSNGIV